MATMRIFTQEAQEREAKSASETLELKRKLEERAREAWHEKEKEIRKDAEEKFAEWLEKATGAGEFLERLRRQLEDGCG